MSVEQSRPPAYVPRSYCQAGNLFGTNATAAFASKRPGPLHQERAEASRLQHLFVIAVRSRLHRPVTMRSVAKSTGIEYGRLSRLLNGHYPMRLTEMAAIARAVGLETSWQPTQP